MAQGAIKKTSKPGLPKGNKRIAAAGPTKRGSRIIAPKKTNVIAKKKLIKKHSSGLTGMTERALAQKAGHLEILAGGKRSKKKEDLAAKKKADTGK